MLRSRAQRGVSKHGNTDRRCCPSFETRPSGAPQDEVIVLHGLPSRTALEWCTVLPELIERAPPRLTVNYFNS
jgi:hypothetical protein